MLLTSVTTVLLLLTVVNSSLFEKNFKQNRCLNFAASTVASVGLLMNPYISSAFGPIEIPITVISYKQVELCNGQKPIMPGQKAAEGLFPVCIEVDADVASPETKQTLSDVSVYGFVKEDDAGNSVLPNNPDFKSDSGQYAMVRSSRHILHYNINLVLIRLYTILL